MSKLGIRRLVGSVDDLRLRCEVDINTGCWNWLGALASDGTPRLYTFDHARSEKRTMSGPLAAWNIAHQRAPLPGWLVHRRCGNRRCLCPVHLAEIESKAEMGRFIARSGRWVGTNLEQRRASVKLAQLKAGQSPTPEHVVRAIRAADPGISGTVLAAAHGIAHQTVSRIRRFESHRGVV